MSTITSNSIHTDHSCYFDMQNESSLSSCSSSPPSTMIKPSHVNIENDSGCGSDDDPTLALKINKGLSMGYDYELIKSVIEQQSNNDDMSKFIETIVRKAEVNGYSTLPSVQSSANKVSASNETDSTEITVPHDVYIIDGVDLAYSYNNNSAFSWRGIEICLKYLHSHGHKKVFVILPYSLKHHRHDQHFGETKSLRDLERKNLLVYTNRILKQTAKPSSYTHICEMLKFSQKLKGHIITNVLFKDVILDFTVYKQILEEKVIRYRFQNDNFQPLLVTITNDEDGNDCEKHYPLCPYGKKCTYGIKCKYYHIERRHQTPVSVSENLQMKTRTERSKVQHYSSNPLLISNGFNHTKSSPEHLHLYASPMVEQSLVDDARMAYEYGLTSTPVSNDFSFVDQSVPSMSQTQHSWFPQSNHQAYPYMNRSYSMPQHTPLVSNAMVLHQQNWARQQQLADQNFLQYLSMLSLQQQSNINNNSVRNDVQQQDNQYDHPTIDSQQGLADKILAVRHLWESEKQPSSYIQQ